jgi:hypothetical protein
MLKDIDVLSSIDSHHGSTSGWTCSVTSVVDMLTGLDQGSAVWQVVDAGASHRRHRCVIDVNG